MLVLTREVHAAWSPVRVRVRGRLLLFSTITGRSQLPTHGEADGRTVSFPLKFLNFSSVGTVGSQPYLIE